VATTISNPASFSSVRTAFNAEGYGISTSFFAYRQGEGIVPATSTFNVIGAGTAGDPLRMSQFSGFVVPSIVNISNKSTTAVGAGYDSGSATASIQHIFYANKTYEIIAAALGLPAVEPPADGASLSGDRGLMADWLIGGTASDFSMKWTTTGTVPDVRKIGGVTRAQNTYFPLVGDGVGVAAEFSINVNQFGEGENSKAASIVISIAKTSDLSTVLDTATLNMDIQAMVSI
jgi:hypothetical protein